MDDEIHELQNAHDAQDWKESRRLVFYIIRQLNEKIKKLEDQHTESRMRHASWGALSGLLASFIPHLIEILKHVSFK